MPNLICPKCHVELRCERNEVQVLEKSTGAPEATLWSADLYACPECGVEIIAGFAAEPTATAAVPHNDLEAFHAWAESVAVYSYNH